MLVEVSGTFALQFGSFFFSITMFVEEGCKCEEGDELKSEEDELEGSPAAGERVTAGKATISILFLILLFQMIGNIELASLPPVNNLSHSHQGGVHLNFLDQ